MSGYLATVFLIVSVRTVLIGQGMPSMSTTLPL